MLITYIEHTEEQGRNESENDDNHRTFAIGTIVNLCADALSGCLWREEECIEGVIETAEPAEFASFLEVLTELLP